MSRKILRMDELVTTTGLRPSTIYKLIKHNKFPKGINLTSRSTGWDSDAVFAWLNERMEGSKK